METYGKILMIATPAFLLMVISEKLYAWYFKKEPFKNMDMISSLSSGTTNTVKDMLGLSVSLITYEWMVQHWAIYHIKSTVLTAIVAFLALDLTDYISHRISHKINFFWNLHIIHHSSEEFNLACALRQSISSLIDFFTIFLLPAALLGVSFSIIATIVPIHLFAQFWYHTIHIGKLGFLEKIIVTPSYHRVHHAINPEYLDKNLGSVFIFWDKMFSTFQEELDSVPPVYGITRPVSTWNPIKINFQHLWLLIQDAHHTDNLWDKLRIWVMPTGWRPADVIEKYPVKKIEDVYSFQKYAPTTSRGLIIWIWCQLIFTLFFLLYFFDHIAQLGVPNMFVYGAFLYMTIYAYTELMGRNSYALYYEISKNIFGFAIIWYLGDWFGCSVLAPWFTYFAVAYFMVSSGVTYGFVRFDFQSSVTN